LFPHNVPTLSPLSWFPHPGDLVLDSPAATPLIRHILIIIPMGTIGARMFTTILIPIDTRIITARHIGTVVTGPTTVIIASITTIGRNFEAWPDCRAIARRFKR
jgi:hypothetical protein